MPNTSPWHRKSGHELDVPDHDPETCAICAPTRTPPYRAGVEAATTPKET